MDKDTRYLILWLAFVAVFVAPTAIYFVVSLYGWLFFGGSIDAERTIMALIWAGTFGVVAAIAGVEL